MIECGKKNLLLHYEVRHSYQPTNNWKDFTSNTDNIISKVPKTDVKIIEKLLTIWNKSEKNAECKNQR